MAKKKKKINYMAIIGIATFLIIGGILLYGGSQGWFNFIINVPAQNQTLSIVNQQPSPVNPTYSTCQQLCAANNFNLNYLVNGECKPGENRINYGYPGQPYLLQCCCYNEVSTPSNTCTDSDGGQMFNIGGKVTTALGAMYDACQPNGMDLLEFYCENGAQKSTGIGCANGCIDSATGDYCSPTKVWHAGDTVFSGSGTGTLIHVGDFSSIDLNEYGITVGGNCQLGAQIQTSWVYENPVLCTGVWGMEGVNVAFYDSNGFEYNRIDATPIALGIDLNPSNGHNLEWDGVTPWRGEISKFPDLLPNCIIDYEYSLRIYIFSCS